MRPPLPPSSSTDILGRRSTPGRLDWRRKRQKKKKKRKAVRCEFMKEQRLKLRRRPATEPGGAVVIQIAQSKSNVQKKERELEADGAGLGCCRQRRGSTRLKRQRQRHRRWRRPCSRHLHCSCRSFLRNSTGHWSTCTVPTCCLPQARR